MLIFDSSRVIPDDQVILNDGFVYIISHNFSQKHLLSVKDITNNYTVDVIILNPEYDNPLTLEDIAKQYPNVKKVIYEEAMSGYVYNYGNHGTKNNGRTNQAWEQVGTTCGYY